MLPVKIFLSSAFVLGLSTAVANAELESLVTDFDGQALQWRPSAPHGGAVLNLVQPDGQVIRREFSPDDTIDIDLAAEALQEGQYLFELTLLPVVSAAQRDQLSQGRLSGEPVDLDLTALRQQGAFRKVDGEIHLGSLSNEAPSDQDESAGDEGIDQTFTEDVEIQGSLCVGIDCTTAESFGFDTVRIKENNLRIHFNDTSNSASFPGRDWRIAINGSNNGDPDFFAVQDADANSTPFRILGGAPNNSLYVDDSGDVGVGIDNPVVELHIRDGDSPALRLEQDQSAGFGAQTWDLAGNETNFFVRDVTNGSQLPIRVFPDGGDDMLVVRNDRVGVGTDNPQADLHVRSASTPTIRVDRDGDQIWELGDDSSNFFLRDATSAQQPLRVHPSAGDGLLVIRDNAVGIGQAEPQARLHVSNGNALVDGNLGVGVPAAPSIPLEVQGTTGLVGDTGIGTNTPFARLHVTGGVARFDEGLFSTGSVGIGTTIPQSALHVAQGDIWLESGSAGIGTNTPQGRLHVAGGNTIMEGDLGVGTTLPAARLHVVGGDAVMEGNVGVGTTTPEARLHVAGGDLRVDGAVYQLSSRAAKTNLTSMDASRLLNLLSSLDLFNWTYSSGSDQGRHFGPTAEEFHALFGLGQSERHISVADMAGVALGAAQALQQELVEKERELDEVKARLERLERLLDASASQ